MLNNTSNKTGKIFNQKLKAMRNNFLRHRKNTAEKLNNPRLKQISFHTLRHWKGTTEYHNTKDIYHVKTILGHKCIANTEIYINIEQATFLTENSEYHSATAKTIQEAQKLIEARASNTSQQSKEYNYSKNANNPSFFNKRAHLEFYQDITVYFEIMLFFASLFRNEVKPN